MVDLVNKRFDNALFRNICRSEGLFAGKLNIQLENISQNLQVLSTVIIFHRMQPEERS